MSTDRRQFLTALTSLAGAALLTEESSALAHSSAPKQPISCNAYTWNTFYQRAGKQ